MYVLLLVSIRSARTLLVELTESVIEFNSAVFQT